MDSKDSDEGQTRLPPPSTPGAARTPNRRAISADPTSGRRSASARRPAATPHARAAVRAIDQRRRTIFTPGRNRRRSLRDQRETPRDILRNLSKILAPATQPVHSSSSSSPGRDASNTTLTPVPEDDDNDDDFPIERPRFSLPLREDDDDDSDLKAPRLSGLEDDNYTATSIELPRRAWSEGPSRLGRESLGSVRFSDYAGPDLRSDDIGIDSAFFPPGAMEDDSENMLLNEPDVLERFDAEDVRRQTLGRESLFGPIEIPEGMDETTFLMATAESSALEPTIVEEMTADEAPDMIDDDDDNVNEPMDYPDLEDFEDLEDIPEENEDDEVQDDTIISKTGPLPARRGRTKAGKQVSKYGIEYPSLPKGVVKRLATTFAKTSGISKAKISPDAMTAIMQATDWFFEQVGDDLSAYAKHAGRKTIDESDMVTLMRRYITPVSYHTRYSSIYHRVHADLTCIVNGKLVPPRRPFHWLNAICQESCSKS